MDAPPRKRRDRLEDALGSTLYTSEPLPPFIEVIENLVYLCYRADPEKIQPWLSTGLTADPQGTVILCFWRNGMGWGIAHSTGGFFAPVVQEYPAPDTSESCLFLVGVGEEPFRSQFHRHYGPFQPGGSSVEVSGARVLARMWSADAGELIRAECRIADTPPTEMTANDRYLGVNAAGHLVSTIASVAGPTRVLVIERLEIPPGAPPLAQALRPQDFVYGALVPTMLCNWSGPERIWQAENQAAPGRAALLEILDRQSRAVLIASANGHVVHANTLASRLLAGVMPGHADPLCPAGSSDRTRFQKALRSVAEGRRDGRRARFLLPRADRGWPLMAELAPADPALAGPGMALVLLTDPARDRQVEDPSILQLLGLTPAEARIAAAVGAGLPPREAALRLGLAESTVRSSLKVIFGKLGLTRQAELARLIARLEV